MLPKTLIIAGFDPISGAGITADIKTIQSLNVYPCSVISSITIQNTKNIQNRFDIEPEIVRSQLDIIFDDIAINSIKIGMIPTKEQIDVIYGVLKSKNIPIVLDPVFVSSTGFKLTNDDVKDHIKKLIKISKVVTPNIVEAETLSGIKIKNREDTEKAAKIISDVGCEAVLIKGGDKNSNIASDMLYVNNKYHEITTPKLKKHVHGTGCHLSSSIAAYIARGYDIVTATSKAKEDTYQAICEAQKITKGDLELIQTTEYEKICRSIDEWAHRFCNLDNSIQLVPHVGINIAYIPKKAKDLNEIIGITGRIVRHKDKPEVVGHAERGGSKHIATVALTAHKLDPAVRSVMNIKTSDKTIDAAKSVNLSIGEFDRTEEPENVSTMAWGTDLVIKKLGKSPDLIFDRGAIGKEQMIRVLGKDVSDVSKKVELILSKLNEKCS